jgi:mono/diheme cytochrome c family protein
MMQRTFAMWLRSVHVQGSIWVALALSSGALAIGCAATPAGATDASLAKARSEAATGATLYAQECAKCHGDRGEGRAGAPPIIGTGALPVYPRDEATGPATTDPVQLQMQSQTRPPGMSSRDPFRNAQDLYKYVSTHMPQPQERAGSLKPDEYWAIITFILIAHGSKVPAGGVTAANASTISM